MGKGPGTGLRGWVTSHGHAIAAAVLLLVLATAASVARCTAIHQPDGGAPERGPEQEAEEVLPERARALRRGYSDATKEAVGLLAANVWADAQGTSAVTFTDKAMRVASAGREEWIAYAVVASAREGATPTSVTTLCLETAEWSDIAKLTIPAGAEGGYATLRCASICGGAELRLSPILKELELDGIGDSLLEAHGTTARAARAALAEWCALWRPTATTATWTQVLEEDHVGRSTSLFFELDDQRSSKVTLVVCMDDGTLEIKEGGR